VVTDGGGPQAAAEQRRPGGRVYRVYPMASVLLYNGATLAHYGLGTAGILLGYAAWPAVSWTVGIVYALFALGQMYVLMPLAVCPNCAYRRMEGSRCIAALNQLSAKMTAARDPQDFPKRAQGILCHNNLYMASLVLPLPLVLPALVVHFSVVLLAVFLAVAALLAFRILVIFPRVACVHCAAKGVCPNARSMGIA
jgi:hypothetical protein